MDQSSENNDTLLILQEAVHEGLLPWAVERAGGGDGPAPKIYYGALSVAVLTLGLLLFVEALRRQLDHSAIGRPFFQAVLEGVYRELATLGVVELFIHLLQEYSSGLDQNKKALFADIHFLLFYTAIFNAFQSVILAIFVTRVSHRTWVKTEELELNHYVEIREEFDRVRQKLYGDHPELDGTNATMGAEEGQRSSSSLAFVDSIRTFKTDFYQGHSCWDIIRRTCWGIFYTIKYPRLKAKYNELLVQVRFHEMRVHFLQAYDLPLKLKISNYLIRSEQAVLKHLIHVSTSAWLWLTALINVLYFIDGMVAEIVGDSSATEITLLVFFGCALILFLVVSLFLWRRMQTIFMKILSMKHLWDFVEQDNNNASGNDAATTVGSHKHKARSYHDSTLATEQKNLFFFGDPRIVVSAIQFMQFGYAISVSLSVVFWEDMEETHYYLLGTLGCYAIFVYVVSRTLPKYTMCTSLGQLVDRKRLHETVALFRLEEAERRRRQTLDNNKKLSTYNYSNEYHHSHHPSASGSGSAKAQQYTDNVEPDVENHQLESNFHDSGSSSAVLPKQPLLESTGLPAPSIHEPHPLGLKGTINGESDHMQEKALHSQPPSTEPPFLLSPSSATAGVAAASPFASSTVPTEKSSVPPSLPAVTEHETLHPEKANLLVDLVKMDTSSLRQAVPLENIRSAEAKDRRRNRRKSVSDGVALMSQLGQAFGMSDAANQFLAEKPKKRPEPADESKQLKAAEERQSNPNFAVDDSVLVKRRERRKNRKKAVSASAAVQEMREMTASSEAEGNANSGWRTDFWKTDSSIIPAGDDATKPIVAPFQGRRRNRKKAVSASAAVQDMREMTAAEEEGKAISGWRSDFWKSDSSKPKPPAVDAAKPIFAPFQKPRKLFASSDDSATVDAAKQRRESRRRSRKKSLSASAAVSLMRDYPDEDVGQKLPKEDFWSSSWPVKHATVPEGDEENHDEHHEDASLSSPYDPLFSTPNNDLSLSPVKETSAHFDDSSSHNLDAFHVLPAGSGDYPATLSSDIDGVQFNGDGAGSVSLQEKDEMDDDDETVDTAGSVGGLSDVDDVEIPRQTTFYEEEKRHCSICVWFVRTNDKMRRFFLSEKYTFATHMVGTMVCFFLVGMRVEGFLQEECIIPFDDHSWDLELSRSFWSIVGWIAIFMLESFYIALLFPPCINRSGESGEEIESKKEQWIMFLAAVYDLLICGASLAVFLIAEELRCCNGEENQYDDNYSTEYDSAKTTIDDPFHRFLAEVVGITEQEECQDNTLLCICPTFGTRLEGSVGAVEPFTSFIGLRAFRFLLARRTVLHLGLGSDYDEIKRLEAKADAADESRHHTSERKSHYGGGAATTTHDGLKGAEMANGTIVELWQAAITNHSDIVDRYGEFSSELLLAMLGLEITEEVPRIPSQKKPIGSGSSRGSRNGEIGFAQSRLPSSNNLVSESISLDKKKYSKLCTEAQEIIAAGKVGMPCRVKSSMNLNNLSPRSASSGNLEARSAPLQEPSGPIEFEVDIAQMELDNLEANSAFSYPNARLLRSMRRCERKLLPLLDHWTPVDVIMTNHEIVYVHVSEGDGSDNADQAREAGQQALKATKGGKGLRLCDVAAGRRIIGQMTFDDIVSVHVEREHCLLGAVMKSGDEAKKHFNHGHIEFWQDAADETQSFSPEEMQKRWESINQDSLKLDTIHGTLYLRFYSDLEESEENHERINEIDIGRPIYKDIALQWAQTIVRQCNVEQLKQPLSHFGTNDSDELRDLIQIVQRGDEKQKHRRMASGVRLRKHRPKRSSMGSGELGGLPTFVGNPDGIPSDTNGPHPLKGSKAALAAMPRIGRPKKITRFGSFHDEDPSEPLVPENEEEDDDDRAASVG